MRRRHEAEALTVLADIAGRCGDPTEATTLAARVLSDARHALGDHTAADENRQRATQLLAVFGLPVPTGGNR